VKTQRHVFAGYGADSQMYIYRDGGGPFVCCFCIARDGASRVTTTGAEMADHLQEHEAAGHRVPRDLADRLRAEVPS
jgi:hypothetical protein